MKALLPSSLGLLGCLCFGLAAHAQTVENERPGSAPDATSTSAQAGRNQTNGSATEAPAAAAAGALRADPQPDAIPPANTAPSDSVVAGAASCELGPYPGIDENDARTAGRLVCDELLRQKAPLNQGYRVELMRLGTGLFLSISIVGSDRPGSQRRIRLASVEEIPDATPRLVTALLQNKEVEKTQEYGNLLQTETRTPLRKGGAVLVGAGVTGQYLSKTLVPGFELSLRYDTPRWVIGSALRYGGISTQDRDIDVFTWGVGGRYMLTLDNVAPFVGTGLALQIINVRQTDARRDAAQQLIFDGHGSGTSLYAEAGVELLRHHKSRLTAALRLDAPHFKVRTEHFEAEKSRYYLPVSFALTYFFN